MASRYTGEAALRQARGDTEQAQGDTERNSAGGMNAVDRIFMDRAIELAKRGVGSTSPNPPVGAVLVKDGEIVGEGFHQQAGEPHAEIQALRSVQNASGATLYASLEPCNHFGRTPPCTQALIDARIARVVIGAHDPNPKTNGAGVAALKEAGIRVDVLDDANALQIIEPFAIAIRSSRPYIALKMASSADGYIASRQGEMQWLTGDDAREFVRELRFSHDAVMVGAATIRVDDPLLTVRPPHDRARPYHRVIVCESTTVPSSARVFMPVAKYSRTIVIAPAGMRMLFESLQLVAEVLFVGTEKDTKLDLPSAMRALRERGIESILCEGGPTLAARLLEQHCVDRVYWLTAPVKLAGAGAVPALAQSDRAILPSIDFERVEPLGEDMLLIGVARDV